MEKIIENIEYGNISFGEITKLLIDIIGQNVILDLIPQKSRKAYKKDLERIYREEGVGSYTRLSVAKRGSPQWYFAQFFKNDNGIENRYGVSELAMELIDSFTWQLFFALGWQTPFETPKKDTMLFLIRKQVFYTIYEMIKGDHEVYGKFSVTKEAILKFITDDYDKIFSSIESNIKTFHKEFYKFCDENRKEYEINNDLAFHQINIKNWRNGNVYNPTWKMLKPVLDILYKNGKVFLVHRLVGLYLLKNTQKAINEILDISIVEQEKMIIDLTTMIIEDKNPEEFYLENYFEFSQQINTIYMCLAYQHQENIDREILNNIINEIELKCDKSKLFFSIWLKARAAIFIYGESLKENPEQVIDAYKKAFNEGKAFAGIYLEQFLYEAIMVNMYLKPRNVKNINDLHGYGYALELFPEEMEKLLEPFNNKDGLENKLIKIHYLFNPRGKMISSNFPELNEFKKINKKAIEFYDLGLEYFKDGDYEISMIYFTDALLLNPNYVNAYTNLGNVCSKMGFFYYDDAVFAFNSALLLDPKNEKTLFQKGIFNLKKDNLDEAINDFSLIINNNSEYSITYLKRGICYMLKKDIDLALKDFNIALEKNENNIEAYFYRSKVYEQLGENTKAQNDIDKATNIINVYKENKKERQNDGERKD